LVLPALIGWSDSAGDAGSGDEFQAISQALDGVGLLAPVANAVSAHSKQAGRGPCRLSNSERGRPSASIMGLAGVGGVDSPLIERKAARALPTRSTSLKERDSRSGFQTTSEPACASSRRVRRSAGTHPDFYTLDGYRPSLPNIMREQSWALLASIACGSTVL
jgi:hypothetical protein